MKKREPDLGKEEEEIEREKYSVERSVEGMLGDLFLEAVPYRRSGSLDGKRDHPVSGRH